MDSGLVVPGEVLARRYRLEQPVGWPADARAEVWRARDEVLARPVAVKVLGVRERQATAFLQAAARAGAVDARPLTRIYDAAVEPRGRQSSLVYVIGEWVDGVDLADLLTSGGPLPPGQVRALGLQATGALAAVHAAGAIHGRLHPGNVLVTATGRLRITDTEVAAVLHEGGSRAPADDVRDLAAVLLAMLTGRWPASATLQPARGLPLETGPADTVRRSRPLTVEGVARLALRPATAGRPDLFTAGGLQSALEGAATARPQSGRGARRRRLGGRAGGGPTGGPGAGGLGRSGSSPISTGTGVTARDGTGIDGAETGGTAPVRRRVLQAALVALLLIGTAAGSYALRSAGPGAGPTSPVPPVASSAPVPVDLASAAVRDLDPAGVPPQENPEQVPDATDGDPATAWTTERYRTARFGGLKPGVGLLVDLGAPTALAAAEVDLTSSGAAVQLRAGSDPAALAVVAAAEGPRALRLAVPTGTTARYWLLWVTRLPPDGAGYRAGVAELRLLR